MTQNLSRKMLSVSSAIIRTNSESLSTLFPNKKMLKERVEKSKKIICILAEKPPKSLLLRFRYQTQVTFDQNYKLQAKL